jgi:NAD(P)-dependent dehydrogenase (short-subunit alcohol dehydrogenase family)
MVNPMDLTGRRILVTGASGGIGRAIAVTLSQLGARIVAAARNPERLAETLSRLEGEGHRTESFDLSAVDQIPAWLKSLTADTGPLDGLVHSAGVFPIRPLQTTSRKDLADVLSVNFEAAFMLTKGFRQRDCHSERASVVYLSSVAATRGEAGLSAYAASKGALESMTRVLARELARDRIRVNAVAAGLVETAMAGGLRSVVTDEQYQAVVGKYPLGIGAPRDVALAVAFLLAETGRWITGASLIVDGGYSA